MVADSFYHRLHARVAHRKPLTGQSADKGLPGGGSVEGHVANNHILLCHKGGRAVRVHDQLAARQAFAEVVVGLSLQFQTQPVGSEGRKALPGRPLKLEVDGSGR